MGRMRGVRDGLTMEARLGAWANERTVSPNKSGIAVKIGYKTVDDQRSADRKYGSARTGTMVEAD